MIKFDEQVCKGAGLDDIDEEKVGRYLKRKAKMMGIQTPKISFKQVLVNLGIAKKNKHLSLTNAGILFFGKKPQKFIPHSEVKIARFKGTSTVEFIDRAELQGSLPDLIDEAEKFVKRNTRMATKIVEFEQVNIAEYPYEAIREAITNAVCHRDYLFSGASVRIMIFDDRIVVESPGKLPAGITLKTLEGSHVLRNEMIGSLLYDIGYIEKWGTGIRRMKDSMRDHGLEEPKFEEVGNFFKVTFYGPGNKILDLVKPEGEIDLRRLGLNNRQIEALKLMVNKRKKMTIKEHADLFKVSEKTAKRDMRKLVELKMAAKKGVKKGAYFEAA
jgi:predicted HTH transcriptional regulator